MPFFPRQGNPKPGEAAPAFFLVLALIGGIATKFLGNTQEVTPALWFWVPISTEKPRNDGLVESYG